MKPRKRTRPTWDHLIWGALVLVVLYQTHRIAYRSGWWGGWDAGVEAVTR